VSIRKLLLPVVVATGLIAVGCAKSDGVSPVAQGFNATTLAQGGMPIKDYYYDGTLEFTPASRVYAAVLDFPQPAGENAPTGGHVHPSGFVYDLTGETFVNLDNGTHITVTPGEAVFAPPFFHHTHSNPGPGPDNWLFLGVRGEDVRDKPLPSPEGRVVINSADLPPLVAGATYMLRLQMDTLRPSGQTPTTKLGGATLLYMLDGQNTLAIQGQGSQTMMFDHANFLPTGSVYQMRNPSTTQQTQVLVMTFWLSTLPPATNVNISLP